MTEIVAVYVGLTFAALLVAAHMEAEPGDNDRGSAVHSACRIAAFAALWPLILPAAVIYGAVLLWRKWLVARPPEKE